MRPNYKTSSYWISPCLQFLASGSRWWGFGLLLLTPFELFLYSFDFSRFNSIFMNSGLSIREFDLFQKQRLQMRGAIRQGYSWVTKEYFLVTKAQRIWGWIGNPEISLSSGLGGNSCSYFLNKNSHWRFNFCNCYCHKNGCLFLQSIRLILSSCLIRYLPLPGSCFSQLLWLSKDRLRRAPSCYGESAYSSPGDHRENNLLVQLLMSAVNYSWKREDGAIPATWGSNELILTS